MCPRTSNDVLKIMLNIGAKFQYSERLMENSNPQKMTFSEVLSGTLPVLSWQPISLFISEHLSSYSAYILINTCSLIWYSTIPIERAAQGPQNACAL